MKILFYISTEKFVVYKIQQLDRLNIYSKHTKPGIFLISVQQYVNKI